MPVFCTRCGAPIHEGQRFCDQCGAPAPQIPARPQAENKPQMDLSSYFDSPAWQQTPPSAPRQAAQQTPRRVPQQVSYPPRQSAQSARPVQRSAAKSAAPASGTRSDRALNIALMVLGVLAIAVLTFTIILLLWPKGDSAPVTPASSPVPIVTPAPAVTADPGQQSPAGAPAVQIVTPTPLPTAPLIVTPSPSPVPTPTPAPEYLLPESNSRYLTAADLSGLSHEQLCFARNEIFARHGRIFKTPEIAAYFNSKSWYKGTVSPQMFSEKVFNQFESYNVGFIRDYENKYYGGSYY